MLFGNFGDQTSPVLMCHMETAYTYIPATVTQSPAL